VTAESDRSAQLAGLLSPDGSLIVPAGLAADVLRRLVRDMSNEAYMLGVVASPAAQRLLYELDAAARRYRDQAAEPAADPAPIEAVTVRDMAERMGCSVQWIRQQLKTGRLTGRKSGRVWIVYTGPREAA
jgi:hypothetical protein